MLLNFPLRLSSRRKWLLLFFDRLRHMLKQIIDAIFPTFTLISFDRIENKFSPRKNMTTIILQHEFIKNHGIDKIVLLSLPNLK